MREDSDGIFRRYRVLYEEAIRKHVCEHCIDFEENGSCRSKDPEGCAIFRYLPQLVQIALELHERKIDPYVEAVRARLCSQCKNSKGSEHCELRDNVDCGLNRYLPLVLDAIEEVNQKIRL